MADKLQIDADGKYINPQITQISVLGGFVSMLDRKRPGRYWVLVNPSKDCSAKSSASICGCFDCSLATRFLFAPDIHGLQNEICVIHLRKAYGATGSDNLRINMLSICGSFVVSVKTKVQVFVNTVSLW